MKKWFMKNKWMVYVLPSIFLPIFITMYGLVMAVKESFADGINSYRTVLTSTTFFESYVYSLKISFLATMISLLIGLWVTRIVYKQLTKTEWKVLVWIPMVFPHFVAGYMIVLLLSQTGFVSSFLSHFQLIESFTSFPLFIYDSFGFGILVTYIWKEVPFVVLMLLPAYVQMDQRLNDVVSTLGGSKWDRFITVEWPWLAPVVFETGIIIFSFILAAYEVPALLGTTYPKMISVLSYDWFYEGDWSRRPMAFAAMILVTTTIMMVVFFFSQLLSKKRYRLMKGNGRS
ncbi:ABC transporter permease subunit [Bacillus sp. FJAT-47783]|uniref:ABC transporter permease n=1 Tax=Bacillus sp. FJAT-47783 TaxID=2922712 RepID=UPI001FAC8D14|nr:ABC transporter permease subunit [Bacillus sp. FJAT-47783]